MAEKFLMPKLSPTMEEGQFARWIKNEGDSYESGETLAEVDTDKATMEMTASSTAPPEPNSSKHSNKCWKTLE